MCGSERMIMSYVGIGFYSLLFCFWLAVAFRFMRHTIRLIRDKRRMLATALATGLVLSTAGFTSFFGIALSASGGLNWLPKGFEWPVGFASNVIRTSSGQYVVPMRSAGRIQVYDAQLRFVSGWAINTGGGVFKLLPEAQERYWAVTARGQKKYQFDSTGRLISEVDCSVQEAKQAFESTVGESLYIPTLWPLLVFAHPLLGWVTLAIGAVTLGVVEKISNTSTLKQNTNAS